MPLKPELQIDLSRMSFPLHACLQIQPQGSSVHQAAVREQLFGPVMHSSSLPEPESEYAVDCIKLADIEMLFEMTELLQLQHLSQTMTYGMTCERC